MSLHLRVVVHPLILQCVEVPLPAVLAGALLLQLGVLHPQDAAQRGEFLLLRGLLGVQLRQLAVEMSNVGQDRGDLRALRLVGVLQLVAQVDHGGVVLGGPADPSLDLLLEVADVALEDFFDLLLQRHLGFLALVDLDRVLSPWVSSSAVRVFC